MDDLTTEVERLRGVLAQIAYMECYTREGEEPPHLLMMRLAKDALPPVPACDFPSL